MGDCDVDVAPCLERGFYPGAGGALDVINTAVAGIREATIKDSQRTMRRLPASRPAHESRRFSMSY